MMFMSSCAARILSGDDSQKPGFVRLNLSVLMSDEDVAFILNAVKDLADRYSTLTDLYWGKKRAET